MTLPRESFQVTLDLLGEPVDVWATAYYLRRKHGISLDRVMVQHGQGPRINVTALLSDKQKRAIADFIKACHEAEEVAA